MIYHVVIDQCKMILEADEDSREDVSHKKGEDRVEGWSVYM